MQLRSLAKLGARPRVGWRLQSTTPINVASAAPKGEPQLMGGLPRRSFRPPPLEDKVPFVAGALGAAGLIPFLFYGLSSDDNDEKKPRCDRLIERLSGYVGLSPDFFSAFKAGNQVGVRHMLENYAATIMSFMGAVHWGFAMQPRGLRSQYVMSNLFPIAAWGILNMRPGMEEQAAKDRAGGKSDTTAHVLPLRLLAGSFVALHFYDELMVRKQIIPPWYSKLRVPLTFTVVATLLASARFATATSTERRAMR